MQFHCLPIARPSRAALLLVFAAMFLANAAAWGQDAAPAEGAASADATLAEQQFDAAMAQEPKPVEPAKTLSEEGMDLLHMASPEVGGIFMYPIYLFSFVVVLFGIERAIALRRAKVIPSSLMDGFDDLITGQGGFDPRKAYKLCEQYPSAASQVLRAALLKIGRPLADLENAVLHASEREAARLYTNIRPLNLAATVAPLLGLIGTVQGMIQAFYVTAHLPDGANKAQSLAEGVYIALVTTFAGLCVAIPAVCLAHFFEGKIQRLFRELDDLLFHLLPVLERYDGKLRPVRPAEPPASPGPADAARPDAAAAERPA